MGQINQSGKIVEWKEGNPEAIQVGSHLSFLVDSPPHGVLFEMEVTSVEGEVVNGLIYTDGDCEMTSRWLIITLLCMDRRRRPEGTIQGKVFTLHIR